MRNVIVNMVVGGRTVRKINHQGRSYLPVEEGEVFQIEIQNNRSERVVAIVSVDGLSVMNGKPAGHNDPGYVIDAYSTVTIDGYRKGSEKVREFVVTPGGESYSAKRTGSERNNGVIGVVIKPEKGVRKTRPIRKIKTPVKPWDMPSSYGDSPYTYSTIQAKGMNSRSMNLTELESSVGTGMGDYVDSHVKEVHFNADESRKSMIVLYYDTPNSLRRRGVPIDRHVDGPNPFPNEPRNLYCPDA